MIIDLRPESVGLDPGDASQALKLSKYTNVRVRKTSSERIVRVESATASLIWHVSEYKV